MSGRRRRRRPPRSSTVRPSRRSWRPRRSHDLLVLGTHGRRGPSRWWLGSVAERVVRDSPVPALVVRAEPEPTPAGSVFARPVAACRPRSSAARPLNYAQALAASFGGNVAEKAVSSLDDLTCDPGASLMVVATARHHGARLVRRHGRAPGQALRAADAVRAEPRLMLGRKSLAME
ncbi:MAG: universal stress protein [Desulfobacterales bacterium]|nr:universal stress protein [Desulfobacterales bacterium]